LFDIPKLKIMFWDWFDDISFKFNKIGFLKISNHVSMFQLIWLLSIGFSLPAGIIFVGAVN